jgi:hypothetical protein
MSALPSLRALGLLSIDLIAGLVLYWTVSQPLGVLLAAVGALLLVSLLYQLSMSVRARTSHHT